MIEGREKSPELQGIINVYKPVGITSFFVVSKMRQLTGIKKIGHCGTLDPFAEGCLLLCLGRATAAVRFMDSYDKAYRAEICLGLATDSEDCTGVIIAEKPVSQQVFQAWQEDDYAFIRRMLKEMEGKQEQVPPMHSAIKINGQPLYKLARQGVTVERKARQINVYQAKFVSLLWRQGRAYLTVDFYASKGTYVRTLGVQLAKKLGTIGHLTRLIRMACGPFTSDEAVHLMTISESVEHMTLAKTHFDPNQNPPRFITADTYQSALIPTDAAFSYLPRLDLTYLEGRSLLQGKKIPFGEKAPPGSERRGQSKAEVEAKHELELEHELEHESLWRLYGEGRFIGIGALHKTEKEVLLKAERMFIHIDYY